MKPAALLFAAGVFAGGLFAWLPQRSPAKPVPGHPPSTASPGQDPAVSRQRSEPAKRTVADVLQWAKDADEPATQGDFDSWSTAELRRAMEELLADPNCINSASQERLMLDMLLGQWLKRDLEGCLQWFETVPSETMRAGLSYGLASHWPEDRALEALEYAVKHPGIFSGNGGPGSMVLVNRALQSSAVRGVDAVVECLRLARESGLEIGGGGVEFPPDFDFKSLAGKVEVPMDRPNANPFFMQQWLKQNREEAFAGIVNLAGGEDAITQPPHALLPLGWRFMAPEEVTARAALLGTWLNESGDKRQARLDETVWLATGYPGALESLIDTLHDPADQTRAHLQAVHSIAAIGTQAALDHLAHVNDPAERLDYLENLEARPSFGLTRPISSGDEALLRETLSQWGADTERTERIVGKLQKIAGH